MGHELFFYFVNMSDINDITIANEPVSPIVKVRNAMPINVIIPIPVAPIFDISQTCSKLIF